MKIKFSEILDRLFLHDVGIYGFRQDLYYKDKGKTKCVTKYVRGFATHKQPYERILLLEIPPKSLFENLQTYSNVEFECFSRNIGKVLTNVPCIKHYTTPPENKEKWEYEDFKNKCYKAKMHEGRRYSYVSENN